MSGLVNQFKVVFSPPEVMEIMHLAAFSRLEAATSAVDVGSRTVQVRQQQMSDSKKRMPHIEVVFTLAFEDD